MASSGQKFVGRNRAPRVQIEYDVELYGSEKKVQLPFVMGVMSDLSGNAGEAKERLDERKFSDVDVDNFDDYLKSTKPKVSMSVPNALSGEGEMNVELSFESMDDFSPAAIAARVEPLAKLLEARTELANLRTYMDGKAGAEELLQKVLEDPALMKTLSAAPAPQADDAKKEG